MQNEFVPYQPSLDMKELGFDEPCLANYNNGGILQPVMLIEKQNTNNHFASGGYFKETCTAPLYQQAFRFFREKYEMEGITQRAEDFMWYKWTIYQYNENGKKYVADWYEYKTYEEAELACLVKLIEITKTK